jgi:hypothetical protein
MNCFPKANGTRGVGTARTNFAVEILIRRVHTYRENRRAIRTRGSNKMALTAEQAEDP